MKFEHIISPKTQTMYVFLLILILKGGLIGAIEPSDSCATIDLPPTFYLRGQWEAYWHEKVYITPEPDTDDDAGEEFGIYESICLSFNGDVELTDDRGEVVGRTDVKTAVNWGVTFNIEDCTGRRIWIVDEDSEDVIINGLNPFESVYTVYEATSAGEKGEMIGFSADGDVSFDSEYSIRDMTGQIRADAVKDFGDDFAANFGSDTTWEVRTYGNGTAYPYDMILGYLVALKEVQDRLEGSDASYDTCTSWALAGIVIAGIIGLALIVLLVFICYLGWDSSKCKNCREAVKSIPGNCCDFCSGIV